MKLNNYENRHDLLIDWLLEKIPKGKTILDIGANDGSFCPEIARVAKHSGTYLGVDPDFSKLENHPLLDARFPELLEDADIEPSSVDCAYAIYVFEHVADADRFLSAASRILKPGGSLFFITPNGYQYFAFIASLLQKLGIQSHVLKLIRPSDLVDDYHYPAMYRLNNPRKLRRFGKKYGFDNCEFRYSERLDEFACYFPGILKVFPILWEKMVLFTGKEYLLGNLMGRMIRN